MEKYQKYDSILQLITFFFFQSHLNMKIIFIYISTTSKFVILISNNLMNRGALSYESTSKISKYLEIAQKLSKCFGHFAEDPNIQRRWVWQLIQNAKDVPNQFGKVKIRITVNDDSLQFSHNGDPFRGSDLESIVSQYSSKIEENKEQIETTGKYGTGFITTYYLSKFVTIKGIIKHIFVQNDSEQDSQSQRIPNSEKQKLIQQQYAQNELHNKPQKKIKKPNNGGSMQIIENNANKTETTNTNQAKEKIQCQQISDQFEKQDKISFSRFQINLNRDYKDREKFASKLMKNEQKNIQMLRSLKQQQPWTRTQNDYDTSFTYLNLKQDSFKAIDQGIKSVYDMFPYALLFNPNLYQIQILDKRTKDKMQNITITKKPLKREGVLNISSCLIKKGEEQTIIDLAFTKDKQTNSIVCVPIQIQQKKIKVLSVCEKVSKIFKQFPLLGCQDTGYNFVFTSRKFYPDEKRSNLLLKLAEGKQNKQANQNLRVLKKILQLGLQLYKVLMSVADNNIQNFYKITHTNFFEQSQIYFKKFVDQILNLKIIPKQNDNKKVALKDIVYFKYKSLEISNQMNSLFHVLYPSIIISQATHESLYENLSLQTWKLKVKFVTLRKTLQLIAQTGYEKLCKNFGSSANLHEYLQKIYKFLAKHKLDQFRSHQYANEIKFILTNKNQLQNIDQLKQKHNLPKAYEDIAKQLGIDIQKNLIKDNFQSYFEDLPKFTIHDMEKEFDSLFKLSDWMILEQKPLKLLIRFCKTFGFGTDILELVGQILQYVDTSAFIVDAKDLKKLKKQTQTSYTALLLRSFLLQFNNNILQKSSFTVLDISKKFKSSEKLSNNLVINWWNLLFKIQDKYKQNIVKYSISMNMTIKPINQLNNLEFTPTDQQLAFVNHMDQIFQRKNVKPIQGTSQTSQKSEIRNILLHPDIEDKNGFKKMTVQKFFQKGMANYTKKWLEGDSIKIFLDFYETIIQQSIKKPKPITERKLKIFKQVRSERHKQLLQIINLNEAEADIIYQLIKHHRQDLPNLHKILEKYDLEVIIAMLREINK